MTRARRSALWPATRRAPPLADHDRLDRRHLDVGALVDRAVDDGVPLHREVDDVTGMARVGGREVPGRGGSPVRITFDRDERSLESPALGRWRSQEGVPCLEAQD